MFTTKLTGLALHSTPTESQYMKTLMDVYVKYSKLSMDVRQCLGISSANESMFVKLCELPEYIKISQEVHKPKSTVSGTLRLPETSHYLSTPKLMWSLEYSASEVEALLKKWREWHTEVIGSYDYFYKLHMCDFTPLERRELKALTLGERYGCSTKNLRDMYCNTLEFVRSKSGIRDDEEPRL